MYQVDEIGVKKTFHNTHLKPWQIKVDVSITTTNFVPSLPYGCWENLFKPDRMLGKASMTKIHGWTYGYHSFEIICNASSSNVDLGVNL